MEMQLLLLLLPPSLSNESVMTINISNPHPSLSNGHASSFIIIITKPLSPQLREMQLLLLNPPSLNNANVIIIIVTINPLPP